jgi:hypothetical protein
MSGRNRQPYLTSTVLDQDFLDDCADNLSNGLELVAELNVPNGAGFPNNKIYFSDRNKYVGEHYYEARTIFPDIKKDIGEYLSPNITFSSLKLEVSNVDGLFNTFLPGGDFFDSMINQTLVVKLGLRDVESTYITIFEGSVTEIGGFGRTVKSFLITARDKFDQMRETFPTTTFTAATYPLIEDEVLGTNIPVIYGDWTVNLDTQSGSSIPAFVTNGLSPTVQSGVTNVNCHISSNINRSFDNTSVVLRRGEDYWPFNSADITNISGSNNTFEVIQGGATVVDGGSYQFQEGDNFFCRVTGKDIGVGYQDNAIQLARQILIDYGGVTSPDFSTAWDTLRDKNTPAQSNLAGIKSRLWVQNSSEALTIALSILEQVRCEAFINKDQKIDISTLHFEDWDATPDFVVRNWDVQRGKFNPKLSFVNKINRTKGFFNYLPEKDDNFGRTSFYRNTDSINQIQKTLEKGLVFPNLYVLSDVNYQVIESLRLTSALFEEIEVTQTWRSMLLDISDFVGMDVQIGSTFFENVPCLIRSIGYKSKGMALTFRYWSMQSMPFPGWAGQGGGIVGGYDASITEET